jgi:hypothetical protein
MVKLYAGAYDVFKHYHSPNNIIEYDTSAHNMRGWSSCRVRGL